MFGKKIILFISIALLLVLGAVFAFAYENPGKPTNYVTDFAGVLNNEQINLLSLKLREYQEKTTNQVFVVVIKSLDGDYIENYAVNLFKDWGIGQKGIDNGVLLLLAMDEKEMRIEVGYGLEPYLIDSQAGTIIRENIAPYFKDGKYYEGINAGVDKIISKIGETPFNLDESNKLRETTRGKFNIFDLIFFFPFVFIILVRILGKTKSWWLGGVLGGVIGVIFGLVKASLIIGAISSAVFIGFGLIFDYLLSRAGESARSKGDKPWWDKNNHNGGGGFFGGGFGGGSGGFGGGGGGFSGGGGSSGRW